MYKRFCFLLLTLFVLLSTGSPVFAASRAGALFAVSLENTQIYPGESVSITLTPQHKNLSAFILTAEFDSGISSASAKFSNTAKEDHSYTSAENGRITVVYAADSGTMPQNSSVTLTFRTNAQTTALNTTILLSISDAADAQASPLLSAPEVHRVDLSFIPESSADCSLVSLSPPIGQLSPRFDPNIREYTLDVPFSCTSLEWEAVPADGAAVRVNRKNLGAGGSTTDFHFTVTAADGKTKAVYTVHVTRLTKEDDAIPEAPSVSTDCTLLVLSPPTGALSPAFDPNIYEYTLEVPFVYQSMEWDVVPADDATVRVNRKNLGAGGSTTDFHFTVTAADGKTKAVYTVHVTRLKKESDFAPENPFLSSDSTLLALSPPVGELSPVFAPDIYEYTLEVPFTYQSLEWDAVPADDATVRVNRKNLGAGGSTTDFHFTVTAADGKTKAVYTVHVTRLAKEDDTAQEDFPASADCTLLALSPPVGELSPAFAPDIYEYTLNVPFSYKSLEWDAVPADDATVRVNRKNLGAGGSTTDFHFTVTAADGKAKSVYTVHVTRLKKGSVSVQTSESSSSASKNSSSGSTEDSSKSDSSDRNPPMNSVHYESAESMVHLAAPEQNSKNEPLLTAALVLVSAAAGMVLVLGAQYLLQRKKNPKD